MLELTLEQKRAADALIDFALDNNAAMPFIALAGYAGTGKTTVMGHVGARLLEERPFASIAWCAPTGKAASVLKDKLENFGALNEQSSVDTIHGHIYQLLDAKNDKLSWARKGLRRKYDLIIVDEASMVTGEMFDDLLSYNLPVIFIGDSGQLPPVGDLVFAPLVETEVRLETVHRQALENPIIAMATKARFHEEIDYTKKFDSDFRFVKLKPNCEAAIAMKARFARSIGRRSTMFLCGLNNTRHQINNSVRAMLGFRGALPQKGEHILCLQNEKQFGIYNGEVFECGEVTRLEDGPCYRVELPGIGKPVAYSGVFIKERGKTLRQQLADDHDDIERCLMYEVQERPFLFDYGYALSVHKAQGSEWDNVLLYDERNSHMTNDDYARWLYTGITRARNRLCILG